VPGLWRSHHQTPLDFVAYMSEASLKNDYLLKEAANKKPSFKMVKGKPTKTKPDL
jgi:hypothetical protein